MRAAAARLKVTPPDKSDLSDVPGAGWPDGCSSRLLGDARSEERD